MLRFKPYRPLFFSLLNRFWKKQERANCWLPCLKALYIGTVTLEGEVVFTPKSVGL